MQYRVSIIRCYGMRREQRAAPEEEDLKDFFFVLYGRGIGRHATETLNLNSRVHLWGLHA